MNNFNIFRQGSRQEGFTFVELIISIGIIALMSVIFWTNLHADNRAVVRQDTERLAAEIRQMRSLVIAQVPEKSLGEYPPGGYGIQFYNDPPRYIVFADVDDALGYQAGTDISLKERSFADEITSLVELGGWRTSFYFRLKSTGEIITNIDSNPADYYAIGVVSDDYRGNIRLGEDTEDGFLWANMGISYDVIDPAEPSQGGGKGSGTLENSG